MTGENMVVISGGSYDSSGDFAAEGSTVTVWTTKLDHNVDKPLTNIPEIRQDEAMENQDAPGTKLVDLGRIKELITLQGYLHDETTEAAVTKKANLLIIVYHKKAVKITWGTGARAQTYYGNVNKCMITETAGIVGQQQSGYECEKNFAIQLSLLVGKDVQS